MTTPQSRPSATAQSKARERSAPLASSYTITGDTTQKNNWSSETRPKNVAVTFCRFDGEGVLLGGGAGGEGDNLGDHTATQNLDLSVNKLVGEGGTDGIYINSDGNVGIGTDNPGGKLDISSEDGHLMRFGLNASPRITFRNSSNATRWTIDSAPNFPHPTDDTDFRVFSSSSDSGNSGTVRLLIQPAGNVGIGTTAPNMALHVSASGGNTLRLNNSGATSWIYLNANSGNDVILGAQGNDFSIQTGGSGRFFISNSGNVGIGTGAPEQRLHVAGSILSGGGNVTSRISSNEGGAIVLENPLKTASNVANSWRIYNMTGSHANSLQFWRYAQGTNCADGKLCGATMSLHDSGFVHIGSGVSSGQATNLRLQGASGGNWWVGPGNAYSVFYVLDSGANGVYLPSGTNSWLAQSDERLKEIIEPIRDASEGLMSLRAVVGRFHTDDSDKRRIMLIAQDVQQFFPELVYEANDEEKTLGMNYGDMTPVIIKAFQELKSVVNELVAKLAELFDSVANLRLEMTSQNDDIEILKAENAALRSDLSALQAANDNFRRELDELRSAIGE